MARHSQSSESEGLAMKSSASGKSGNGAQKDGGSPMADFFQAMDPQKMFAFARVKSSDFGPLLDANIDMMRTFDGIFQSWAAGLSARNQERIHALEEVAKCENQGDAMKIQNECLQRLTKHWMTDSQKLGGIFFDAVGKVVKEGNSCMMSTMQKVTNGSKPV